MPVIVVPDVGEPELLGAMVRRDMAGVVWHLHLFANDYVPESGSTLADLTECTFSGYDIVAMNRPGWTAPAGVGGIAVSYWGSSATTWTAGSGSQLVYGAYVTDAADALLLWAWRFDAPQTASPSSVVRVRPWMRLRSMS